MRPVKAIVILGISGALAVLPYMRANAAYCCDPWGIPATMAFTSAASSIVGSITAQVTAVSNYLQLYTAQTWSNGLAKTAEELSKQTAANRTFEQGRIAADTSLYMTRVSGDAEEQAQEPALLDQTVTNAVLLSEQFGQQRLNRRRDDAKLAEYMRGDTREDVISRNREFCDARGKAAGFCDELASSTLQNADISFNTISNPGDGQYETLTDAEARAARAFVRNVVSPTPPRSMAGTTAQDQQHEALLLADQAVLSLAAHSLHSVMQNRVRKRDNEQ
ncbi:hypothetical protein N7359_01400 [Stenotrophomonas maltophilia]|uniref:hypothetical protein n=1 Tax=Stenotrophomonas maltophilia TaxID=40324 RepID=UPI00244C1AE3|nr:hypothetical protein [Stenotrophomonas maltophilia]MDH0071196.1 hypothetical protein [Stenotrophomonas maltophilia]MDH0104078.1 hypothetical protein [Stenotrophomonas maltophilia]MDH0330143.1 hypothetical protein [Stenotrophomonas maltophilia]